MNEQERILDQLNFDLRVWDEPYDIARNAESAAYSDMMSKKADYDRVDNCDF